MEDKDTANEVLKNTVKSVLEIPLARLLSTPKLCDLYYDVFRKTLCRNCRADKEFAYRELFKWLNDGE